MLLWYNLVGSADKDSPPLELPERSSVKRNKEYGLKAHQPVVGNFGVEPSKFGSLNPKQRRRMKGLF